MKKIYVPMIRYGEKDFDEGFVGWGFNSYDEQIRDARGVMKLIGMKDAKILDVGCGLAIYHRVWLDAGYTVTGIDLSETFIFMANLSNESYPNASYRVENIYDLTEETLYDFVTQIDMPVEDSEVCENIFRAVKPGGCFIFQVANPGYKHLRGPANLNHRNWSENDDNTLTLTKNEYNPEIDRWEYEEWHIDVENSEIVVQHHFSRNLSMSGLVDLLLNVGFSRVGFFDYNGKPFLEERSDIRNYFGVAYKGE